MVSTRPSHSKKHNIPPNAPVRIHSSPYYFLSYGSFNSRVLNRSRSSHFTGNQHSLVTAKTVFQSSSTMENNTFLRQGNSPSLPFLMHPSLSLSYVKSMSDTSYLLQLPLGDGKLNKNIKTSLDRVNTVVCCLITRLPLRGRSR